MNMDTFQRAQVVAFAYRAARRTGSLDAMKAIIYILRNRVKAGWAGGNWLGVLESAWQCEGNTAEPDAVRAVLNMFDAQDTLLQRLLRDVDGIMVGETCRVGEILCNQGEECLYYAFVDRPVSSWFETHIVRQPEEHPQTATVHPVLFYR